MQNSSECVTQMLYQEHFVKMRLITQGELEIQIYPSSRLLEFWCVNKIISKTLAGFYKKDN
jgi:hypothetical protein